MCRNLHYRTVLYLVYTRLMTKAHVAKDVAAVAESLNVSTPPACFLFFGGWGVGFFGVRWETLFMHFRQRVEI